MPEEHGKDQGTGNESVVTALVGEGKKYATIEDLAKSRIEADNFIDTLKDENATLRKTSQEAATAKEILDAIKSSQKDSNPPEGTPLDDEDLQKRITDLMETREVEHTRKANRAKAKELVSGKLNSSDDEAINEYVKNKAASLGMSADDLWELSEKSPHGFTNLTGLSEGPASNQGNPTSLPNQNTEGNFGDAVLEIDGHKTKKWFDAKRKEMGNRAFINSREMQLGQIRAREALGEKYNS